MTDFDTTQMQQLMGQSNVTVVYLWADGDYWVRQQEFCTAFRAAPPTHNVVIHVQFEGLSLTQARVVETVQKIMQETGRSADSVFVYSPNAITNDTPWINLFWRQWKVSDEFVRSKTYQTDSFRDLDPDWRPWALFVGRSTTPRLLALHDIWQDPSLKEKCLLSKMIDPEPPVLQPFDQSYMVFDQLEDWIPISNPIEKIFRYYNFRKFCSNLPMDSIDGYKITDQYINTASSDNRNVSPTQNLINLSGKYLFEITFETMTRGLTFTPSEKTIRTIMAEKPLIVYAPQHFLQHMQQLGFKTFGDLWDESYDTYEGPDRYKQIMKIVKNIANMSASEQLELYKYSRQICSHNKQRLIALSQQKVSR
jgi:hypothetical protein